MTRNNWCRRRPCWTYITASILVVISSQTIVLSSKRSYVRAGAGSIDKESAGAGDNGGVVIGGVKDSALLSSTDNHDEVNNNNDASSHNNTKNDNDDSSSSSSSSLYGVDVSFPIHTLTFKSSSWRQEFYNNWLEGCRQHYPTEEGRDKNYCDQVEEERVQENKRQPSEMVNFTDTGFKKICAPDDMFEKITTFWKANKDNFQMEEFGTGDTTVNHWASEASFVNIKDESFVGGGPDVEDFITTRAETIISNWVGHKLRYTSLYGIRTYYEGAVLSPHIDRNPLICSAIINVDQDVDEPWPLEVYGRDGMAYNVTMEPGDMVLYESHSLIHGRPFPLKGRYFANIFIHFEPAIEYEIGADPSEIVPFYIKPNSTAETLWRNYQAGELVNIYDAARNGKLDKLLLAHKYWEDDDIFQWASDDGWQPIHEAAYGGQMNIVKFLVEEKEIDVNTLTDNGTSSLYLAQIGYAQYSASKEEEEVAVDTETSIDQAKDNRKLDYQQTIEFLQQAGGLSIEGTINNDDNEQQQHDDDIESGEGDEF